MRMKLRTDIVEPRFVKETTDSACKFTVPSLHPPKTAKPAPKRAKDRTDNAEPIWANPTIATAAPKRANDRTDKEEPK